MGNDFIPTSDTIYRNWLENFLTVANANLSALGLLSSDLTGLSADKTTFDSAMTDLQTKKAAMKASTQSKDSIKFTSISKARSLVKRIQATANVPSSLKAQLQITVPGYSKNTPIIPSQPTNLVANIVGNGRYELKWNRNGNAKRTLFVIEAIMPGGTNFVQVMSTTKTSFTHLTNLPTAKIVYRIRAQHREILSPPSNTSVVNDQI